VSETPIAFRCFSQTARRRSCPCLTKNAASLTQEPTSHVTEPRFRRTTVRGFSSRAMRGLYRSSVDDLITNASVRPNMLSSGQTLPYARQPPSTFVPDAYWTNQRAEDGSAVCNSSRAAMTRSSFSLSAYSDRIISVRSTRLLRRQIPLVQVDAVLQRIPRLALMALRQGNWAAFTTNSGFDDHIAGIP
jgi:hypothetical protein